MSLQSQLNSIWNIALHISSYLKNGKISIDFPLKHQVPNQLLDTNENEWTNSFTEKRAYNENKNKRWKYIYYSYPLVFLLFTYPNLPPLLLHKVYFSFQLHISLIVILLLPIFVVQNAFCNQLKWIIRNHSFSLTVLFISFIGDNSANCCCWYGVSKNFALVSISFFFILLIHLSYKRQHIQYCHYNGSYAFPKEWNTCTKQSFLLQKAFRVSLKDWLRS